MSISSECGSTSRVRISLSGRSTVVATSSAAEHNPTHSNESSIVSQLPNHQGTSNEEVSSNVGDTIMSLVYKKNSVAASSYNLCTGQVHIMQSITETRDLNITMLSLRSVVPSVVVLPSKSTNKITREIKDRLQEDQLLKQCQIQCLAPRYFMYEFARRALLESTLWPSSHRPEDSKNMAILSLVDLNDERLVCALGGLLYHISTGCPKLSAGLSPSSITSVQHITLDKMLWIDSESLRNLQIFDPIEHPSSFNWSSANMDEGKSIFSLFERHCSSVGNSQLKSILSNPINCHRTITKRHEVIEFYLDPNNRNAVELLRAHASQMSSSNVVMGYLMSPTLRGGHWKHIYRHIYYTVSYAEVCRSFNAKSAIFRELGETIVDAVYSMAHNLERVVDLVNMENNEVFVIKYGFYPPLDAAKEKFSRLKVAMDRVTPYEFDSVPSHITRLQMMYIPEMMFLLSIPYWAPDLSKEDLNLPNLDYKFSANKTAFYKSRRCYELDELLGDAQTDIMNEESLIIQSLRNYLKQHMHHVVQMAHKISEIECFFAMAKAAREEHYVRPQIVGENTLEIIEGWHPLLELPTNQIITNGTVSSTRTSLVKLIYGPNASGKSIYLKQTGIIMYLVHIGSYVPASAARVGLLQRILSRTTKEESIISMSSTMLTELKKIQDAVLVCPGGSLIVLDEVGKGSTEMNCVAILASALNYFLSLGDNCPHVLVSTHLSGISEFIVSEGDKSSLFELLVMDYTISEREMVFLHKLVRGRPDSNFVFEVIENARFAIASPILQTARLVLDALRSGENLLPYCGARIQRSYKYLNFIRKFVNIDMTKPGYVEKLQNKIQRYYEKPSY